LATSNIQAFSKSIVNRRGAIENCLSHLNLEMGIPILQRLLLLLVLASITTCFIPVYFHQSYYRAKSDINSKHNAWTRGRPADLQVTSLFGSSDTVDDVEVNQDDLEIKFAAQTFFNELRGTKPSVSVKDLASSYYFEEMLQDGFVTKKDLANLTFGKRLMDFELFYSVCCELNKLQDDFVNSTSYNIDDLTKKDDAKALFNELRVDGSKVSLAALKSIYYFDEMLKDGIVTKEVLADITQRKRQFDFETFYKICCELDNLTAPKAEVFDDNLPAASVGDEAEPRKKLTEAEEEHVQILDKAEELEIRREMSEDEVENARIALEKESRLQVAITGSFNKLLGGSQKLSIEKFKSGQIVADMLAEGVVEPDTVDSLAGILGLKDDLDIEEYEMLLRLLDEATGTGLIEVHTV
jgi:hypothetical protein